MLLKIHLGGLPGYPVHVWKTSCVWKPLAGQHWMDSSLLSPWLDGDGGGFARLWKSPLSWCHNPSTVCLAPSEGENRRVLKGAAVAAAIGNSKRQEAQPPGRMKNVAFVPLPWSKRWHKVVLVLLFGISFPLRMRPTLWSVGWSTGWWSFLLILQQDKRKDFQKEAEADGDGRRCCLALFTFSSQKSFQEESEAFIFKLISAYWKSRWWGFGIFNEYTPNSNSQAGDPYDHKANLEKVHQFSFHSSNSLWILWFKTDTETFLCVQLVRKRSLYSIVPLTIVNIELRHAEAHFVSNSVHSDEW